jgi:RHS repeat-associated protein
VTLPGSGGTVSFSYDPFGRRIKKVSSSGTSIFAYDADNLIEETNSSGTVVARYSQGLNIDEPLAMLRSGATSFYNADGLGTITSLANTAGSLAETYTFDSFGKQTASSGSLMNPFQYASRELDTETGLYYYRARYYESASGRFLKEDPIRFKGGANFYRYVRNNPVNLNDPFGLNTDVTTLPWWWWLLANPADIPIVTVGAGGAAVIILVGELTLAPATARDDVVPKPRTLPCPDKFKHCEEAKQDCIAACLPLFVGKRTEIPFHNCIRKCLKASGCEGFGNNW